MKGSAKTAGRGPSALRIRPAHEADRRPILALLRETNLPTDDLAASSARMFYVAGKGDELLGCAAVETFATAGLLRSVAVRADQRGVGIATALVSALERAAAGSGIERLFLLTTSAPEFFARIGYVVCDRLEAPEAIQRSPQFAQLCPKSAVCLSKALRAPRRRR